MKLTMTRVLTPLAALAVAFGVQGAEVSFEGFENYTAETSVTNQTGWSYYATNDTLDASLVKAYNNDAPAVCPDGKSAGNNYLKLSTEDGILFRNANGTATVGDVTIPSAGLFVDTDVQFTVTDVSDAPVPDVADKFIIWLEADEANHTTNLCAWGGSYAFDNGEIRRSADPVKYVFSNVSIEPGSWHRLTVKALTNVNDTNNSAVDAVPAFQVYIDGNVLSGDSPATSGTKFISNYAANSTAINSLLSGTGLYDHLQYGDIVPALTSVLGNLRQIGFSGEGKIDNVVVTKDIPEFLPAAALTVNWPTALVDGIDLIGFDLDQSGSIITLAPGGSITILKTDLTPATGVDLANYNMTVSANNGAVTVTEVTGGYTISVPANQATHVAAIITIALTANNTANVTFAVSELITTLGIAHLADLTSISYSIGGNTATITSNFAEYEAIGPYAVTLNDTFTFEVVFANGTSWVASYNLTSASGVSRSGSTFTLTSLGADRDLSIVVSASQPVAMVGDTPYDTFAEALDAAKSTGAVIKLLDDLADAEVTVAAADNVVIDLAGNDITGADGETAFTVEAGGSLTITNSTSDLGIVAAGTGGAIINNSGTTTLAKGKFDAANNAIVGTVNIGVDAYFNSNGFTFTPVAGYALAVYDSVGTYQYKLVPSYTISYYNADGSAFTAWASGYSAPSSFLAGDTTALPTSANVDLGLLGVTFNGWTNSTGTAVTTVEGLSADLAVYANVTPLTPPAPEGEDIAPGAQSTNTYSTAAAAEAALADVTIKPTAAVEAAVGAAGEDAYKGMFAATVVEKGGAYTIEVGLTSAAQTTLEGKAGTAVEAVAAKLADVAALASGSETVTIPVANIQPGFYYSISSAASLTGPWTEGTRVLATTSAALELSVPKQSTAGFYKVLINVAP